MKFHFSIEYRTNWGEEVKLIGSSPELGNNNSNNAVALHTKDGITWNLDVDLNLKPQSILNYQYLITKNNTVIRTEWNGANRSIIIPPTNTTIRVEDSWHNIPKDRYYYSSAFTDIWLTRPRQASFLSYFNKSILLKAYAPYIKPNEVLAICGNHELLGNWNPRLSLIMNDATFPEWQQTINLSKITQTIEYKFVILKKETHELIAWEETPNRHLVPPASEENSLLIISDRFANFESRHWKAVGTAVPVFALKTQNSWGIGEFSDLKKLVDWAVLTNQKIIQILPVNDTTSTYTWADSYPYKCISVFALNPIYINLDQIGIESTEYYKVYCKERERLNKLKTIDFPYVQIKKQTYLQAIFKCKGKQTIESVSFKEFYKENQSWLTPYAAYCYLRRKFQTSNTKHWNIYSAFDKQKIKELNSPNHEAYPQLLYYYFIQFHLYQQLKEAHDYAQQKGIVLKGDLPIGIGKQSVDAWMSPQLFNLNSQAGAPPDDFSVQGQNWGFPTYNWKEIAKEQFQWWKSRLRYMSCFFDAYRIDHILGFFRIWSIPEESIHGVLGQFEPALPLSIKEIEDRGIPFNKNLFTKPYIHRNLLNQLFGKKRKMIAEYFFVEQKQGLYDFKPRFNTQKKISDFFQTKESKLFDKEIENILLNLLNNVLFIEDKKDTTKFHPRIRAQKTAGYHLLSQKEKEQFDIIYQDFFYRRHDQFWQNEAYSKLPELIKATNMLVCGEDLGMIPHSVPWVMQDLSILSLEIQRMPKRTDISIANPLDYPYESVSAFSTHDMLTLRGWWEENYTLRNYYYNSILRQKGKSPLILTPNIALQVIAHELKGNSMLCIQAIQDWLALTDKWYNNLTPQEEQINVPSNPKQKWEYRMPCYIEELIQNNTLTNLIKTLINNSNNHDNIKYSNHTN